jgi:hypothetical protein
LQTLEKAPPKRRGSIREYKMKSLNFKFVEIGKRGCDGNHIFIDFATRVAKCVNRFTYEMPSADLNDFT